MKKEVTKMVAATLGFELLGAVLIVLRNVFPLKLETGTASIVGMVVLIALAIAGVIAASRGVREIYLEAKQVH